MDAAERAIGAKKSANARMLFEQAETLVPVLRDRVEQTHSQRYVPAQTIADLRDAGLLKAARPARYGGFELDLDIVIDLISLLGRGCGSTAWVFGIFCDHAITMGMMPEHAQDDIWADDPEAVVSSGLMPSGKVEPAEGGYRLAGRWQFSSGCDHADFALLGAIMPPENEAGKSAPGFIIVPISDCQKIDDWDTMGLAATGSHAVKLEDVFVPVHRSIPLVAIGTADTPGQAAFDTDLGKYQLFSVGAHCLATNAVGCLQGAFDHFVSALKEWETRGMVVGSGAKVMDYPAVQMRVGRAGAALKAAKALLFDQLEHSRQIVLAQGERLDRAERIDNRISQSFAVQLALQGLDELWGAAGSRGIRHAEVVQRAWRDAHAVSHHVSFNWDALTSMYGQHLLGLEPEGQY